MGKVKNKGLQYRMKNFIKRCKVNKEVTLALKKEEFQVYYQPKVESGSTRVVGAEALVRWKKSNGEFVYPDEFIPALEENGRIVEVDYYVYERVFRSIYERIKKEEPVVPVSLNVSRAHLRTEGIAEYVRKLFEKYPIPHKYIEFELTESMYVEKIDMLLPFVNEFRAKGGKISMDDFGSGYSSLNLLTNLPIDTLKVDRIFLKHDELENQEKTILGCVINMAKKLNLDVLCEGVETWNQSWFLSRMGCDMFQGYLYAKAMPEEEFYNYLEQHLEAEINEIHFAFDGNLWDDAKEYEGIFRGEDITYCEGPAKGMSALHFHGGEPFRDCVELPVEMLKNDSYSISMWIYEEEARLWGSVYYAGYSNGFSNIMPKGWNMTLSFRIKDAEDPNGWHDARGDILPMKRWTMVTACYNSGNNVSTLYIDGIRAGIIENVTNLVAPKVIYIGGDIYAKGFQGKIADLRIFDQPLSFEQVKDIYEETYEKIRANPSDDADASLEQRPDASKLEKLIHFPLNGTLWDESGLCNCTYTGDKIQYGEGPAEHIQALHFPGGASMENVLVLPDIVGELEGYTVSYWIKDENPREWVCSCYAETEHGFMAQMPLVMGKNTMFRFKDTGKDNVWNDAMRVSPIKCDTWHQVVLIYHASLHMIEQYIDGENAGMKDCCYPIGRIKKLVFGGDIYQSSFEGYMADIRIYSKAMRIEDVLERTKLI